MFTRKEYVAGKTLAKPVRVCLSLVWDLVMGKYLPLCKLLALECPGCVWVHCPQVATQQLHLLPLVGPVSVGKMGWHPLVLCTLETFLPLEEKQTDIWSFMTTFLMHSFIMLLLHRYAYSLSFQFCACLVSTFLSCFPAVQTFTKLWVEAGGFRCRKLWPTSYAALGMQTGTAHKARLTWPFWANSFTFKHGI